MKRVTKGMVVCCPKCGTAASVSEVTIGEFACKNCNTKFGGWVVDGFVVTFESGADENEDYLIRFENCKDKLKTLSSLK